MCRETIARGDAFWRRYDGKRANFRMQPATRFKKKQRRICHIAAAQLPPFFRAKLLGQFWDNDRGVIVQSKMHLYCRPDDR